MNKTEYKGLIDFLIQHNASNFKDKVVTHTRIGDKDKTKQIYGGSYVIEKEELPTFQSLYYDHVFEKRNKEHLTEVQFKDGGPICVDFDFRYSYNVTERQHTAEHIQDMVLLYLDELKELYKFDSSKSFEIYIFEKPNVNRLEDKNLTKDGIHMLININADHIMQQILRDKIIKEISKIWDLPLTNEWASVLDEGITKGTTNWQLFGSCKPHNETYLLTNYYKIEFDENDGEFMMDEMNISELILKENIQNMCAQNDNVPKYTMTNLGEQKYEELKSTLISKPKSKTKVKKLVIESELVDTNGHISLENIKTKIQLEAVVNKMLEGLTSTEYEIRETHEYTQILPELFYEPGSHAKNREVAFALKYTDERLFLSWVQLRSKASDFDYDSIPGLYNDWVKYFKCKKSNPLTNRSILYWAKKYNSEEYEKIKMNTIEYFMDEAVESESEYDLAQVLRQIYKDRYVCVNLEKRGGAWYVYKNHRWVMDKGLSLRRCISTTMYDLFVRKLENFLNKFNNKEITEENNKFLGEKSKKMYSIKAKLKKTNDKNNILREAAELFFDDKFIGNMDKNKNLMCFNNGVVDFEQKEFRDGIPEDYITKCTKIDYIEYNENVPDVLNIANNIKEFMKQIFPIKEQYRYMFDHLSACLIGSNKNQTFNIYHGSGSNGKSIIADFMSMSLGEYKGTVPITLVTERRGTIGGTSDEVIKLKGVRYAVMQEPSKGVKLNEGVMKELTGGDPIQARGLYCESEVFEPQFSLVVCTNNLFEMNSNDDGTWRRIRKCDFVSKFIDNGEKHTDDTKYVFKKDKDLKDKLPDWAPVFAGMLVKRAFETNGIVKDCDVVMEASNKYREKQDHLNAFINDKVVGTQNSNDHITKKDLIREFKIWFSDEQGGMERKMPKGHEINDIMTKRYGNCGARGWLKVQFICDNDEEFEDE
jgi:P4 family phage/plasmid primase-like protien